ncbi:MAG: hypothetical protein ACKVQS_06155 [Fimbriimonadaceae bacterium]
MMSRSKLIPVALVAALAFAGGALALQDAWKRQYLGKSAFSLNLPGKIVSTGETKVEDKDDWVLTTDDYTYENDDFFILISVFHGKPGTTATEKHLTQVAKDLVTGISENEDSVKEMGRKVGKLDEKMIITQSHVLGKGEQSSLFKSFLLGDGQDVYAVMAVGYPSDPKSVAGIDKVFASIRYKAGLKE